MKTLTPKDPAFTKTLGQICEIMPQMRFIAKEIYMIQQFPQGIRFLNTKGEQVAALSATTLEQKKEAYDATFRD